MLPASLPDLDPAQPCPTQALRSDAPPKYRHDRKQTKQVYVRYEFVHPGRHSGQMLQHRLIKSTFACPSDAAPLGTCARGCAGRRRPLLLPPRPPQRPPRPPSQHTPPPRPRAKAPADCPARGAGMALQHVCPPPAAGDLDGMNPKWEPPLPQGPPWKGAGRDGEGGLPIYPSRPFGRGSDDTAGERRPCRCWTTCSLSTPRPPPLGRARATSLIRPNHTLTTPTGQPLFSHISAN